jgi:hypothetical protein
MSKHTAGQSPVPAQPNEYKFWNLKYSGLHNSTILFLMNLSNSAFSRCGTFTGKIKHTQTHAIQFYD